MSIKRSAIAQLISAGFSPVPLKNATKRPIFRAWQTLSLHQINNHYYEHRGSLGDPTGAPMDWEAIGVVCGYGGLVVIDIDKGGWDARNKVEAIFDKPFAVTRRRGDDGEFVERWKLLYRQDA